MELSTITLDRNAARKAFLEYRTAVRERHNAEDEAIMRGYRELSRGRQLLKLSETIRAGGFDERVSMPRLAICRADAQRVRARVMADRSVTYQHPSASSWWGRVAADKRIMVRNVVPEYVQTFRTGDIRGATVPTIPPPLRPSAKLSNFHILWEAEWGPVPPRDPALLRHLGGDLWAVVAIWDLTELERAVLAGRADS